MSHDDLEHLAAFGPSPGPAAMTADHIHRHADPAPSERGLRSVGEATPGHARSWVRGFPRPPEKITKDNQ